MSSRTSASVLGEPLVALVVIIVAVFALSLASVSIASAKTLGRCRFGPDAHVILREAGVSIAKRVLSGSEEHPPETDVWEVCKNPRGPVRRMWRSTGDWYDTAPDVLSLIRVSPPWIAFAVRSPDDIHYEMSEPIAVEAFNLATGVTSGIFGDYFNPIYAARPPYVESDFTHMANDTVGDVAFVDAYVFPDGSGYSEDVLFLYDANGLRVIRTDGLGTMTSLMFNGGELTVRDRGAPQAVAVASRS